MVGLFWSIDIALAVISSLIMAVVFTFYAKRAIEFKSKFTIGLALFSGALFVQSVLSSFIYYMLAQAYTSSVAIPLMLITILELAGLLSLVYVVEQ